MSVDDRNVIDVIGIDRVSAEAVLTISDHRHWGNNEHLSALQDKLNDYFGFIESGQLIESYPEAVGKEIRINVVCKFKPDQSGDQLLHKARQVVQAAGWSLSWSVLNDVQPGIQRDGP